MLKKLLPLMAIVCWSGGDLHAKGYSSGGGSHSSFSSSHGSSSSHSFSSSPSPSFGSSSSPSHSFSSGSSPSRGSYSSPSPSPSTSYSSRPSSSYTSTAKSYSGSSYESGKTYSAGSDGKPSSHSFSPSRTFSSPTGSSGSSFDSAASRAAEKVASQQSYEHSRGINSPRPSSGFSSPRASDDGTRSTTSNPSYASRPRTVSRTYVYNNYPVVIDDYGYRTRPARWSSFYGGYVSYPLVSYNDPISSAFWWWLMDQSIEERALWAYHNQSRIDAARYQAILDSDAAVRGRLAELEVQNAARNPNYVPPALASNPDLMYSDGYVNNVYASRPTTSGRVAFWLFTAPLLAAIGFGAYWLLFVKRW
ncbi:MAG: hypothetical protein ABR915_00975 [Thermoguttaceae bacterium]